MPNLHLRFDGKTMRRWHVRLCERLTQRPDLHLSIDITPPADHSLGAEERLFFENTPADGLRQSGLADRMEPDALASFVGGVMESPAAILDLCGDVPEGGYPVWRLDFDGVAGEAGLQKAVRAGRSPVATIRAAGTVIVTARMGTESPGIASAAFEDYLARTLTLIIAAWDRSGSTRLPALPGGTAVPTEAVVPTGQGGVLETAKTLALRTLKRVYTSTYHAPHWRIGWRVVVGPDLIDLNRHPDQGWTDLKDDRRRFYADPFPFEHEGTVTLFVEEFEHSRKKGIISAVAFGPDGPRGPLEPVLELPYHLSYPFVFEQDGAIWMIPESCAAGTIDLFRATDFPRGWVHEATLVDGVSASDATIVRHEGRWWMFATVRDEGGSFSDALYLWSAPDFRGPWTPHAHNPVLIDIASARPAGRIVSRAGGLVRPVQDCREGYGTALGLARILRLDDEGFEQRVETILRAGPLWPGRRLHTLNEAGGIEFIDGSSYARKRFFDRPGQSA